MYSLTYIYFGFLVVLLVCTSNSAEIDLNGKFSEIVDTLLVGRHFENITVHHKFYTEIALGTLPLEKFLAMTQQDDLYVQNYFQVFRTLASRETDPSLREILTGYGNENLTEYFDGYYERFNFTTAVQMVPSTLAYSGSQSLAAKYDSIAVALATTYPCYAVWAKMGAYINKIAIREDNPYLAFLDANPGKDSESLKKFVSFVDGYYDRLGNNTVLKKKMLEKYIRAVEHEYEFAEASYHGKPESIPPPQFTDLVHMISPNIQAEVVRHPLYAEIGRGTLPLQKYAVLIQQNHIYLRGFYKAFEFMARKETDSVLKSLLNKDGTARYQWMENQYKIYGFGPAYRTEIYTQEYMEHMTILAQYGEIYEGLASAYPCYFLWHLMGESMSKLANKIETAEHPYANFVEHNDPRTSTSLTRFQKLINGYFERLQNNLEGKIKMFDAVRRSINYEFLFANGIYQFGTNEINGRNM